MPEPCVYANGLWLASAAYPGSVAMEARRFRVQGLWPRIGVGGVGLGGSRVKGLGFRPESGSVAMEFRGPGWS